MPSPSSKRQDSELLFKGAICALIGAIILVAPYVARSTGVRELMAQGHVVGWFALVLGLAFVVQFLVRRARKR